MKTISQRLKELLDQKAAIESKITTLLAAQTLLEEMPKPLVTPTKSLNLTPKPQNKPKRIDREAVPKTLAFIKDQKRATIGQIMSYFGIGRSAAYMRISVLMGKGQIKTKRRNVDGKSIAVYSAVPSPTFPGT